MKIEEDDNFFKKKIIDYNKFFNAYFEELGFKVKKNDRVDKIILTPEERGVRSARRFKNMLNFMKDFFIYCCKKFYGFLKWFFNALMDTGDYFVRKSKKK